jgi:membrane dipeptidase
MNGYPAFVAPGPRPTLENFVAHIDHIVQLVGIDHVGLGIDYYEGMAGVMSPNQAAREYEHLIATGVWTESVYPPPPWYYPAGIERPSGLPRLTDALLARGYTPPDVGKILGGNWLRVFQQVWR